MNPVIWPRTDGDPILDLREVERDGVLVPAMVAVDKTGAERPLGRIVEVRRGGGHVEAHRPHIAEEIGFDRNSNGAVLMHPENV